MRWKGTAATLSTLLLLNACNPEPNNSSEIPIETKPTRQEFLNKSFKKELEELRDKLPHLQYWDSVFADTTKSVMFFHQGYDNDTLPPGTLVAKLHKDSSWTEKYLERQGLENVVVRYPDDDERKETVLDSLDSRIGSVGYNSSRGKLFGRKLDEHGFLISHVKREYRAVDMPEDLVLQQVAESILDPEANSGIARGISQIHRRTYYSIRNQLRDEGLRIHWKDPVVMSRLGAARMNVEYKMSKSFLAALAAYHSGPVNQQKLETLGRRGADDVTSAYIAGLKTAHDLRNHDDYWRVFKSIGTDTRNYAGIIAALPKHVDQFESYEEQPRIFSYKTDKRWELEELADMTGMSEEFIRKYNPHFNVRSESIPPNGRINMPFPIKWLGEEDDYFSKIQNSETFRQWQAFEPHNWEHSEPLMIQLDYFSDNFYEEGLWSMGAAVDYAKDTIEMMYEERRRGTIVERIQEFGRDARRLARTPGQE